MARPVLLLAAAPLIAQSPPRAGERAPTDSAILKAAAAQAAAELEMAAQFAQQLLSLASQRRPAATQKG